MIRHIVLFSACPENVDKIIDTLEEYRNIPGLIEFSVSKNLKIGTLAEDFDIVLQAVVADRQALDAYTAHPIYLAGSDTVRPLRIHRVAVDVEFEGARLSTPECATDPLRQR